MKFKLLFHQTFQNYIQVYAEAIWLNWFHRFGSIKTGFLCHFVPCGVVKSYFTDRAVTFGLVEQMTSNFHHSYILLMSSQKQNFEMFGWKLTILQTKTWKSLLVCKIPNIQVMDLKFCIYVDFIEMHVCANFQVDSIYSYWNIAVLAIFGHFLFWSVKYTSVR